MGTIKQLGTAELVSRLPLSLPLKCARFCAVVLCYSLHPVLDQQQCGICCGASWPRRVSEPEENKPVNLWGLSESDWGRQSRQYNLDKTSNSVCCINTQQQLPNWDLYFKWCVSLLKCNDQQQHYPGGKDRVGNSWHRRCAVPCVHSLWT